MKNQMETIEKIKNLINKSEKILLATPTNLDGDAYGSAVAMYLYLKKLGKKVAIINENKAPDSYEFLGYNDKIIYNFSGIREVDLIMIFDSSSYDVLGNIYTKYKELYYKTTTVCIDHHISNNNFAQINYINPEASSTCEMVYDIIDHMGNLDLLDNNISSNLLVGIIFDTNCFKNANTTEKSLSVSAKCIETGAKHQDIIINMYRNREIDKVRLWGEVMTNMGIYNDGTVVGGVITQEMINRYNLNENHLGSSTLMNEIISTVSGAEYYFLLTEMSNGEINVSLRSKSEQYDVRKIAVDLGGGGHIRAAGARPIKPIKEIKDFIVGYYIFN